MVKQMPGFMRTVHCTGVCESCTTPALQPRLKPRRGTRARRTTRRALLEMPPELSPNLFRCRGKCLGRRLSEKASRICAAAQDPEGHRCSRWAGSTSQWPRSGNLSASLACSPADCSEVGSDEPHESSTPPSSTKAAASSTKASVPSMPSRGLPGEIPQTLSSTTIIKNNQENNQENN